MVFPQNFYDATAPYEGFETSRLDADIYRYSDADFGGQEWQITDRAAATGTNCIAQFSVPNWRARVGSYFHLPPMSTAAIPDPHLRFSVACAGGDTTKFGRFIIELSDPCTAYDDDAIRLFNASISDSLITTPFIFNEDSLWYPELAEYWRTFEIPLPTDSDLDEFVLNFWALNNAGQAIFLDDITIVSGATTSVSRQSNKLADLVMYPNPVSGLEPTLQLSGGSQITEEVTLSLLAADGRELATGLRWTPAFQQPLTWQLPALPPGVYWVRICNREVQTLRKLILLR